MYAPALKEGRFASGLFVLCRYSLKPFAVGLLASGDSGAQPNASSKKTRQAIVWSSDDPNVAHRMVLMYLHASQNSRWFDLNRLIVWGPSAKLLAGDKDLQAKVKSMMKDGVVVQACIVCANSYGVTDQLRALGIEVKGMGKPLANLIKDGWHVLTF